MNEQTIYLLKAFFLGVLEGITEFLPISSTGHLILFGNWINFESDDAKVFEVVIQLGSILAVMWIFRQRLVQMLMGTLRLDPVEVAFTRNLIIAFFAFCRHWPLVHQNDQGALLSSGGGRDHACVGRVHYVVGRASPFSCGGRGIGSSPTGTYA